jgi:hypothetical protein
MRPICGECRDISATARGTRSVFQVSILHNLLHLALGG